MKLEVLVKVTRVIAEETDRDAHSLLPETWLEDLVTDSLEYTELLLVIREAMGPLPDDGTLATIGDVAEHYSKSPA